MIGLGRMIRGVAVVSALALILSACVIGIEGTGGTSTAANAVEVIFRVEAQGSNVNVEQVTYRAGSFQRSVDFPRLPWSTTASARPGDPITMSSVASAASGSTITLSYQVIENGRVIGSGSRTCDQIGCPGFTLQGTVRR